MRLEKVARVGARLHGAGKFPEAEAVYRSALARHPHASPLWTSLGNTLKGQRRFDEAIAAHLGALERNPDFVEAWSNLGLTYQAAGRLDEAVMALAQAVARRPQEPTLQHNLGSALCLRGDFEAASAACFAALELAPGLVPAHLTFATALKELGHNDDAIAVLRAAAEIEPDNADVHWNLGLSLLLEGCLAEGWAEIEWRRHIAGLDTAYQAGARARAALWQGEPLAGRAITLVAEQGLGDTLQLIRFAPLVKARGAGQVRIVAQPRLERLLRAAPALADASDCAGWSAFAERAAGEAEAGAEGAALFAPLFSLPRLCGGSDPGARPAPARYLAAEPALVEAWARRLGPRTGLRVAIAWQGNPQYRADQRRSLALSHFLPALRVPGVEVVSLQKGFGAEQLAGLPADVRVRDVGPLLDTGPDAFVDTAAALMHVDLLLTSDTSLPHLGGGLGREVWLLLPAVPDWRWGRSGVQTPWYPGMRLYRQPQAGDWTAVIARVAEALAARVAESRS